MQVCRFARCHFPLRDRRPTRYRIAMKNNNVAVADNLEPPVEPSRSPVTYNAVKHGLLSVSPVIPLFESEEDWQEFRYSIFEEVQPEGGLQRVLTDRAAVLAWRLMRGVRYERESIIQAIMQVSRDVAFSDEGSSANHATLKERIDKLALTRLLPDDQAMAKILRYEARWHRQLLQVIHQIKLLKGERNLPTGSSLGFPNVDAPATRLFPPNDGRKGGSAGYNGGTPHT